MPGVEGIELLAGSAEAVVVAGKTSAELLIAPVFASEAVSFVSELVALVEEWFRASREFVERGASGGDGLAGFGDCVSCGAAVDASGVGEFVLGLTMTVFGALKIAADGGDGVVVGRAVVLEIGELLGELVDSLLTFSLGSLVMSTRRSTPPTTRTRSSLEA